MDMFLMQTPPILTSVSLRHVSSSLFPLKTPHFPISKFPNLSFLKTPMADLQRRNQPNYERPTTDPFKTIPSDIAPSTSPLLALLTLLPIAVFLLFLAGTSFIGTLIAVALSSPLLLIFSPVLIPAAAVLALSVAGFLIAGAFGVTALSSLSWIATNLRRSRVPLRLQQAKQWARETAAQTAKDAGQAIQSTAQEEEAQAQEGETAQVTGTANDEAAQEGGQAQKRGNKGNGRT